ncbi:MAG: DNA helicase RecQ [Solitalea sp.]
MSEVKRSLFDNLNSFFGFDKFKGDQEAIITNILAGNDTFVIMPTGGGKSMCYQLPALMSEGTAIVISPLIALMKNQVDQVRAYGSDDSIAHFLNSSLNKGEIQQVKKDVLEGKTKLLYVAPESLAKQENIDFLNLAGISFVAVDEAHCISEWGHDFRPEYRKIRSVISQLGDHTPIIALTATATPKVQQDIMKNLQMQDATIFKSSFNRSNLYYEVRPKQNPNKDIIKYIKGMPGKSGIIYCLSRKKVEEVAETLNVNGIRALPYHAGLDAKMRAATQDKFLMEEVDVIVATIAFGMGIDKPDVRFVIHYDMPKSMEGYYQETGRAGRDGGEGHCIAFYDEKDIDKLAKFMKDKPISEREIGTQILKEVVNYAESSVCRRKQILHYFGESYNEAACNNMCDNCRHPGEKFDAEQELLTVLKLVKKLEENFDEDHIIKVLMGSDTPQTIKYQHNRLPEFGQGKEKGEITWKSVVRQAVLNNFLIRDVDNYGLLKLSKFGTSYIKSPYAIKFVMNKDMDAQRAAGNSDHNGAGGALDEVLLAALKELRKKTAKQRNLPPFVIFQDPSLEDMATHYPVTMEEMKHISGVGAGKAMRYGGPFIELIKKYVEENEIERAQDLTVRSTANRSGNKIFIIQNIDRKIPLEDIADSKGLTYQEILHEIESIVSSGTRLNLDYYIDDIIEEERQDEVYDYFRTAEADSIDHALEELGEADYSREELQLLRIKFLSEFGN